ncbi:MAG: IS701 family transposase [Gemmatimonadetes bacterium]|nr:IS701 family transposase [Gemmatimonadota bacterium]
MDVGQIRRVVRALPRFLDEFGDCFGRCDTRRYLRVYVDGQMSELHRKSVEPMALRAGVPPRSLQAFLGLLVWDEDRLVDRLQQHVARDHAHPWAIGVVDETGCGKDGRHTACVQRQWCGSLGKVENCVVSVHTGYAVGNFHCVLDSDLFVPEGWANDPARRQEVGMPEEVMHRSKPEIALAQIKRALGNGIRVAVWTFDEHYGQSYDFLDELDGLGQTYVAEVPCTFCGWVKEPVVLCRPTPQEMRRKGRKRRFPRLSATAASVSEVRNLLNHSPAFQRQAWTPIHIKNGEKGAIVREVKAVRFFMRRDGLPTRAHWLIVTRDPQSGELKFFVSNASPGVPLEWLLYVAYSRWSVEQCFREEKDELGFDHFEVRSWQSIHRHMYLSQVSHLFVNKMRRQLAAEESAEERAAPVGADDFFPRHRGAAVISGREFNRRSGALRAVAVVPGPTPRSLRASHTPRRRRRSDRLSPPPQHRGQAQPYANHANNSVKIRNRRRSDQVVPGE